MPQWRRDLELQHQSDEFMVGAELAQAVEKLDAQLRALLTDLGLVKKP